MQKMMECTGLQGRVRGGKRILKSGFWVNLSWFVSIFS